MKSQIQEPLVCGLERTVWAKGQLSKRHISGKTELPCQTTELQWTSGATEELPVFT